MKNKILTIMFCIFIFGFMIINIITENKELSYSERRYLATLPEITVENIFNGTITNSLETYLTDHFVLRDTFRSIKTIFNKKRLTDYSKTVVVLIGLILLIVVSPTW